MFFTPLIRSSSNATSDSNIPHGPMHAQRLTRREVVRNDLAVELDPRVTRSRHLLEDEPAPPKSPALIFCWNPISSSPREDRTGNRAVIMYARAVELHGKIAPGPSSRTRPFRASPRGCYSVMNRLPPEPPASPAEHALRPALPVAAVCSSIDWSSTTARPTRPPPTRPRRASSRGRHRRPDHLMFHRSAPLATAPRVCR